MDIVNVTDQNIIVSTTNEIIDINVIDQIIDINVTNEVVNVQVQTGAYPLPNNVYSVFGRVGNVVAQEGDYTLDQLSGVTIAAPASGQVLKYNGSSWVNSSEDNPVTSVFGRTGAVTAQTGDYNTDQVGEGLINKYYTDARSRAAISENITGMEYSSASGIFSLASGYVIPTQAMLDAKADDSTTITIDGVTQNIGANRTWQILPLDGTTGQILAKASNTNYDTTWIDNYTSVLKHEVKAGEAISKGQAVYVSSADGTNMIVSKSSNATEATSSKTLGLLAQDLSLNGKGFVITEGLLAGLNTNGANAGDPVWLGTGGNLIFGLANKPSAPSHLVFIGVVTRVNTNNGEIFVKIQNGFEMGELHDYAASGVANNDVITYESSTSLYKPKSIATILGYTPVTSARIISTTAPLTGGGDLSADRTLAITQATTSTNGYLSSTDWNTFNNKQPLITAGTTAQYYRGDKTFQTLNTTAVTEGTNLYYTDTRARAAITGTAPISVVSGVVSISQSSGASNGYLSSTDWNTFNNKQAALNGTGFVKSTAGVISYDTNTYLTTISGISAGGELSGTYPNPTLVTSAVTGKALTGLNLTGGGTIADTDTILGAFGKVQNQISALVGGVMYQGTWNASTNSPSITSSVGTKGHYYIVSVAGSTNINGITDWKVGDWIIFNGSTWDKVDNTDAVSSVNGYTGAVSLVTSDVAESGSLYFTNARAIGSTLTGYTSGAGTISATDSILTAIQKLNGNIGSLVTGVSSVFGRTGAVTAQSGDYTTTQVTEGTNLYYTQSRFDTAFSGKTTTNLTEGTNLYYTDGRVSANADVAANTAARHNAVTLGTANGLSLSTQQLSLGLASSTTNGALSSTDWSTFNAKQSALTFGNLTESTSSVLTITGGSGSVIGSGTSIQVKQASSTQSGFLSSTDWTTFNNKQAALTNPVTGTGTTNYLPKFTGSTTIGDSLVYSSSTGVGIGTSSPTDMLHIANSGTNNYNSIRWTNPNSTADLYVGIGGSATPNSALQNNAYIYNRTNSAIVFATNDIERMRISSSGYVGIGTNNPLTKLDSKISATGTITENAAFRDSSTNGNALQIFNGNNEARIRAVYYDTASDQNITFWTITAGGNQGERMRISANGNIGIATSSAQRTLDVRGVVNLSTTAPSVSSTSGAYADIHLRTWSGATSSPARISVIDNWIDYVSTYTDGHRWLNYSSDGVLAERMRLTGSGTLYIGTTNNSSVNATLVVARDQAYPNDVNPAHLMLCGVSDTNKRMSLGYDTTNNYGYIVAGQYGVQWTSLYIQKTGGAAYAGSARIDNNSDIRVKDNIQPLTGALNKVLSMKGKKFHMLDEPEDKIRLGFIAQELEGVVDELVIKSNRVQILPNGEKIENILGLETWGSSWAALLVEAIKELKSEIDIIKQKA